jgi:hypothetical protein
VPHALIELAVRDEDLRLVLDAVRRRGARALTSSDYSLRPSTG